MRGRDRNAAAEGPRARAPLYEQQRLQSIFQHSAVSLWEEDISALRARLAALRAEGVTDLRAYIESTPSSSRRPHA